MYWRRFPWMGPLINYDRFWGSRGRSVCCYSYDLTAATDRWPLSFMFELFNALFDRSFASAVVNSALATNLFFIPFWWLKGKNRVVRAQNRLISFIAGQPLGYRSSWPLFALTHHALGGVRNNVTQGNCLQTMPFSMTILSLRMVR